MSLIGLELLCKNKGISLENGIRKLKKFRIPYDVDGKGKSLQYMVNEEEFDRLVEENFKRKKETIDYTKKKGKGKKKS